MHSNTNASMNATKNEEKIKKYNENVKNEENKMKKDDK